MNAAYACQICIRQIAGAATHVTTECSQVLWVPCAEKPESHAVAYRECPVESHGVYDHAVGVGTRLGAHRTLLRIAALGVSSG